MPIKKRGEAFLSEGTILLILGILLVIILIYLITRSGDVMPKP